MRSKLVEGAWAVVTGASSGLGRDFALQLAAIGANVVLVARREERLRDVAAAIESRYGRRTLVVCADLSTDAGVEHLVQEIDRERITPLVLVNNAGFGYHGTFLSADWKTERSMLELDIVALVNLTRRVAAIMVDAGAGYILQVASIAAYQSSPSYASYAAAKSFVLNYGEAIAHELRGTGVSCTVLSPGVTSTEFLGVAGAKLTPFHRITMMTSEKVVRIGLRAMLRRRSAVVAGVANRFLVASNRLIPRAWVPAIVNWLMQGDRVRR
ncbi:MAG: SDR family oxidoreductase [Spirochaetaceae bacterium]|nr:MAG: SDR family oxidoreductase [Spirochaetaceae bacterium]